ncbi:uncharacterized protein [Apostichopus japonicus]
MDARSCQTTCDDPDGLNGCFKSCDDEPGYTCVCPDGFLIRDGACIPLYECGCYHSFMGVMSNGSLHVNFNCTRRCTCENDVLHCEEYSCSNDATCQSKGQSSSCECKEGYWGNGTTCQVTTNCQDVYYGLSTKEGIYLIHPPSWAHEPFQVYCKGGWMLFQRRVDASVSFFNDWITYRDGFGDLNSSFWIGNEKIHVISAERDHQLRIEIWFNTTNDASEYLHYNLFRISSEATKYEITLGSYTGSFGLFEFEDLMMKNAGGEQDQRDTISTLGTDMSDQSATTVYSKDGMRISPSTDEMTTGMPKTDTISTLGTDMSDQSATTVYSTDGMRISPSTDELITPFENLVSTTVMPTADETMLLQSTDKMTTIDKEEFSTTSMSSTGHLLPERISHETTRSMNKEQLFMSTVDPSSTAATTRRNELSTTRTPTAESCPTNMIWLNCSCQTTCDDPKGLHGCFKSCNDEPGYTCVCPDGFQIRDGACIPLEECGCYHSPTGVISHSFIFPWLVIVNISAQNGSSHVNLNCTRRCTCENDVLHCKEYSCSHNATCQKQGQSSSCECKESYWGNGHLSSNHKLSGCL